MNNKQTFEEAGDNSISSRIERLEKRAEEYQNQWRTAKTPPESITAESNYLKTKQVIARLQKEREPS